MKNRFFYPLVWIIIFILFSKNIQAQNPTFQCDLKNDVQVSCNVFEFDIYMTRTGVTPFELLLESFGIVVNPLMKNSGTITATILAGSSDPALSLNANQKPTAITFANATNCIKIASAALPPCGTGSIFPVAPGIRICRVRLTNTVPFASVQPNLQWSFAFPPYATELQACVGGVGAIVLDPASYTTNLLANNTLNPTPTPFAVTGGGTYCAGGSGLPVGLANSQIGVTYTLYIDGVAQPATVAGTGAAISFGNQTAAGTYTVSAGCTATAMTGNAIITISPPTAQTITGTTPLCIGGTDTWSSTTAGGTWTSATPAVATVVAGTGVVTGVTAGTSVITYSVTTGDCVNTATKVVTVTVSLTPNITNQTQSIYTGATFTEIPVDITDGTVPSGTTYSWSVPTYTGTVAGGIADSGQANISGTLTGVGTATYTVTPTSGTCVGLTFTVIVTVSPITGIDNSFAGNVVTVYPNPANDFVNIEFERINSCEVEFSLTDALGRVVINTDKKLYLSGVYKTKIPISGIAPGVYSVNVIMHSGSDMQVITNKLIVQ